MQTLSAFRVVDTERERQRQRERERKRNKERATPFVSQKTIIMVLESYLYFLRKQKNTKERITKLFRS